MSAQTEVRELRRLRTIAVAPAAEFVAVWNMRTKGKENSEPKI